MRVWALQPVLLMSGNPLQEIADLNGRNRLRPVKDTPRDLPVHLVRRQAERAKSGRVWSTSVDWVPMKPPAYKPNYRTGPTRKNMDPFRITEPTCISFSGGRTSAYMLWRVLQSNNGLPPDALVCFANTGKEEEATLRFVQRCSDEWQVPITWVEYRWVEDTTNRFAVVDFNTASRNGEPFEALIRSRNFLPNPVSRFCTVELKVRAIHRYLKSIGWTEWDSMLGIRADEQRRLSKIGNQDYGKHEEKIAPLGQIGITKEIVGEFWRSQSFDLELPNMNGVTMHGNCDLCFLKGGNQIVSLIAEKPERAVWWAKMEALALASKPDGARFRKDRPTYQQMMDFTRDQMPLFEDETISCFCGD